MSWGVVVVAGGRVDDALARAIGSDRKCLAVVAGQTCLERVLLACEAAAVGPVAVVTGEEVWRDEMPGLFVLEKGRQIANVSAGVSALVDADRFLFLPADAPFLTVDGITAFVDQVSTVEGDAWLAAGLCEAGAYKAAFPECPKPSLKLKDARWHSGAYFAASRIGFEQAAKVIAGFSEDRRSQLKMALRLGLPNALKFATGRFGLRDGEDVLAKVFGCPVHLIEGADPESVVDIDDPAEYAQVLEAAKRYWPS